MWAGKRSILDERREERSCSQRMVRQCRKEDAGGEESVGCFKLALSRELPCLDEKGHYFDADVCIIARIQ